MPFWHLFLNVAPNTNIFEDTNFTIARFVVKIEDPKRQTIKLSATSHGEEQTLQLAWGVQIPFNVQLGKVYLTPSSQV